MGKVLKRNHADVVVPVWPRSSDHHSKECCEYHMLCSLSLVLLRQESIC